MDSSSDEYEDDYQSEVLEDDDEVNEETLEEYLETLKDNHLDVENIIALSEFLDKTGHSFLAHLIIQLGLEFNPNHEDLQTYLTRYPEYKNDDLLIYLKNVYSMPQQYQVNQKIIAKPLNNPKNPLLDLFYCSRSIWKTIPSFSDTMFGIPMNQRFNVFRKIYLEPYQVYRLQMHYVLLSPFEQIVFWASTLEGDLKITHPLDVKSHSINYTFNALNQETMYVGLRGAASSKTHGKMRLLNITIEKCDKNLSDQVNKTVRKLSPNLPVIASLVVNLDQLDFMKTVSSLLPQVDRVNIYFNQWKDEIPEVVIKNPRITVLNGDKGISGLFSWLKKTVGYHFLVSPTFIYDLSYVPWMISKIQQYDHQAVVGLKGIQLNNKTPLEFMTVPHMETLKHDSRVHLLGLESFAYFTGTLHLNETIFKDHELPEIEIGILGQQQEVSFICVERNQSLVRFNSSTTGIPPKYSENSEARIKEVIPWKYF